MRRWPRLRLAGSAVGVPVRCPVRPTQPALARLGNTWSRPYFFLQPRRFYSLFSRLVQVDHGNGDVSTNKALSKLLQLFGTRYVEVVIGIKVQDHRMHRAVRGGDR